MGKGPPGADAASRRALAGTTAIREAARAIKYPPPGRHEAHTNACRRWMNLQAMHPR